MPFAHTAMYLPISENTLNNLVAEMKDFVHELYSLSLTEYSALLLVARLPELQPRTSYVAERFLGSAIEIGTAQVTLSGLQSYIDGTHQMLSREKVIDGLKLLSVFNITPLADKAVALRDYLTAEGHWDFSFKTRQQHRLLENPVMVPLGNGKVSYLTAEQCRLYREFESQSDEQSHVHGYAGTGKTSLIVAFLSVLEQSNAHVLLLAHSKNQLQALSAKIAPSDNVVFDTFTGLAEKIIPKDLTIHAHGNFRRIDNSRQTIPDSELIKLLGIRSIGGFSALEINQAVRGTLFKFCQSDSNLILKDHLPARFKLRFDLTLQDITCKHAAELWQLFQSPGAAGRIPQVRGYHAVKWAALNQCRVPITYSHVLLDECHSLPKSILQILNNSSQALLTLGDEYQQLKGSATQMPEKIRRRELSHSVRSSNEIECIVNPVISVHPGTRKTKFHGNSNGRTRVEYYKTARVPDQPFVILVSEMWGLFEWAQRISSENTQMRLLSNKDHLSMFVQDCIELYNHQTRARHPELFRFKSWADVERYHHRNPGFQRINRMLEKGFNSKDWQQTYNKLNIGQSHLALGMVEDTLNREYENVMLTPDIFSEDTKDNLGHFCSVLYVGVTRAQGILRAPETLRNWIEDISTD